MSGNGSERAIAGNVSYMSDFTTEEGEEYENSLIISGLIYDVWSVEFEQDSDALITALEECIADLPEYADFSDFRISFEAVCEEKLSNTYAVTERFNEIGIDVCPMNQTTVYFGAAFLMSAVMDELEWSDSYNFGDEGFVINNW